MPKNYNNRTIYNGPFTLPGQRPLDFLSNQFFIIEPTVNLNTMGSVCFTPEAPVVLDESCHPVFNLSFLEESCSEHLMIPNGLHKDSSKVMLHCSPQLVNTLNMTNGIQVFNEAITVMTPNNEDSHQQELNLHMQKLSVENEQVFNFEQRFSKTPAEDPFNALKEKIEQEQANLRAKKQMLALQSQVKTSLLETNRRITEMDCSAVNEEHALTKPGDVNVLKNLAVKKSQNLGVDSKIWITNNKFPLDNKGLTPWAAMNNYNRRRKRQQSPFGQPSKRFRDDVRLPPRISFYEDRFRSRDFYDDFIGDIPPLREHDRFRDSFSPPDLDFYAYRQRLLDRDMYYDYYYDDLDYLPPYPEHLDFPPPRSYPPLPLYQHQPLPPWDLRFDKLEYCDRQDVQPPPYSNKYMDQDEDWDTELKTAELNKQNFNRNQNVIPYSSSEGPGHYNNRNDRNSRQASKYFEEPEGQEKKEDVQPLNDVPQVKSMRPVHPVPPPPPPPPMLPLPPPLPPAYPNSYRRDPRGFQPSRKFSSKISERSTSIVKKEQTDKDTFAKYLQKFINKLKRFSEKENSIQTYENCLMSCHLPLKTFYIVTDVVQKNKKPAYSGVLYINDLFITRTTCCNKKSLKHSVYESAIDLLKTKSVAELLTQRDPGVNLDHNLNLDAGDYQHEDSLITKLAKLQEHIKKFPSDNQPFTVLNLAFIESKCGLRHSFDYEALQTERGVHMYTKAILFIEDQPFANAIALTRKEAKARACQKAISTFIHDDVESIVKEHFSNQKNSEEIPKEIQEMIKKHREKVASLKQSVVPTEQEYGDLLDKMISDLKSPSKHGVNAIMTIDKNCVQLKIKLLTVYKMIRLSEESVTFTCDLFIVDRFIAQGKGPNRKIAQLHAYNKGADILKNTSGTQVLSSFPKYEEEQLKKPDVIDIVYKGYSKMYESNQCRLNRLKQLPEDRRKVSDLVIIEHEEWSVDRKKHAHCILNQSATQCGCLLEWTTEPDNGCFNCTIKLQGEELSTCVAKQRKVAVNLASAKALFKLFETQPVVHRSKAFFPSQWCNRQDLLTLAETYKNEDMKPSLEVKEEMQIDLKIAMAIETKLESMFHTSTLEEFITSPDWLQAEKKYLRMVCGQKGLRVLVEIYCEEMVLVVSKKYDLLQIVEILKTQPSKCHGRYRLVADEEKPSYNDIAGEIAANDSMVKEMVGSDETVNAVPAMDAEEVNCQDDLSLESDSEAFITANTIFVENSPTPSGDSLKVTEMPINVAEIPLPQLTSTPSRSHKVKKESSENLSLNQNHFNPKLEEPKPVNQPTQWSSVLNTDNYFSVQIEPVSITKVDTYSIPMPPVAPNIMQHHITSCGPSEVFQPAAQHANIDVEAGVQPVETKSWSIRLMNTVVPWHSNSSSQY